MATTGGKLKQTGEQSKSSGPRTEEGKNRSKFNALDTRLVRRMSSSSCLPRTSASISKSSLPGTSVGSHAIRSRSSSSSGS